jgi:hypothetical protein
VLPAKYKRLETPYKKAAVVAIGEEAQIFQPLEIAIRYKQDIQFEIFEGLENKAGGRKWLGRNFESVSEPFLDG